MLRLLPIILLTACGEIKEIGGGIGIDLTFIPGIGRVYECDVAETTLELCWGGDAESLEDSLWANEVGAANCGVTRRHAGPCVYCPGGDTGCNALSGCWGCD